MTRIDRREFAAQWTARRVRGVLDGLSLALSDLGELQAEAKRLATRGTPADQGSNAARLDAIESYMADVRVLRDHVRCLSPLPIPEEV